MGGKGKAGKGSKARKAVKRRWGEARHSWRDGNAMEMEKKYLAQLPTAVDSAVRVMAEIDQLLSKVKKDCE